MPNKLNMLPRQPTLMARLVELQEENARLREDAERFRVLKCGDYSVEKFVSYSYGWKEVPIADLDEELDSARKEQK